MPNGTVSIDICAASTEIFDLLHDYSKRLQWDPFLRQAFLLHDATTADLGVSSRCVARWLVGGMAMDTVYIAFSRPHLAAVRMIRGPLLFHSFAASIRQRPLGDSKTRVTYRYHFRAQPRWLAPAVEPIIARVFQRETVARLRALKLFLESAHQLIEQ